MPGSFFDSNVLLYLASDDEQKRVVARELIYSGGTISVQVLNEIVNVARRKKNMSWPTLAAFLRTLRGLLVVTPVTVDVHEHGMKLAERYQLATYDAMIAAAAVLSGCDVLWTEDMHHGLRIVETLTVTNPFRAA